MGYLNDKDYKKIKNIVETFVNNPMVIDNLFKSLVLFLNTKNSPLPQTTEKIEIKSTPYSSNTIKLENEIKNANLAMDKFTKRLLEKHEQRRKKNSKIAQ